MPDSLTVRAAGNGSMSAGSPGAYFLARAGAALRVIQTGCNYFVESDCNLDLNKIFLPLANLQQVLCFAGFSNLVSFHCKAT